MATKKITDLDLRTNFDTTCNIPVDDAVQTSRVTGQQIRDFVSTMLFSVNSSSGALTGVTTAPGTVKDFSSASAKVLHGLVAPSPAAGQIIYITNSGAGALTIAHDSSTEGTAANRIYLPKGVSLFNVKDAIGIYDTAVSRTRIIAYTLDSSDYYESKVSTGANATTSGQYGNITSLAVPAGKWLLVGQVQGFMNGQTTATVTTIQGVISENPGNTQTDHVAGDNQLQATMQNLGTSMALNWRRSYTAQTTVYLKGAITYSAGNPQLLGKLMAIRLEN